MQDTKSTYKNQSPYYTPTMNKLRKNIGKSSIYNSLNKIKYQRINLTKDFKDLYKKTRNH
jgi:hypothetical protein